VQSTTTHQTQPETLRHSFADLGDVRIAYRQGGTGNEAVILIHGLCSMLYTWRDVFDAIAARHRVIALDLKGYGASDKPRGDYGFDAQAEIVLRLMDKLSIQTATVIGNSMGGAIALRMAARWPERVTRLVLLGPVAYSSHPRSKLAHSLIGSTGWLGGLLALHVLRFLVRLPSFVEHRMRFVFASPDKMTRERIETYTAMMCDRGCQRSIIATLQKWDVRVVERDLHLVRQPALVIWGERDRIVSPHFASLLVRDLPQAQLKWLPCGHVPQEEMPAETSALINDFLARSKPEAE
jgi:pimeloyl-ACP methyl ester carboxylesterase